MHVERGGHWTTHLVLILEVIGEWCKILDLQAYGQPNPAAGERVRWTNAHFQLERIPVAEWPLAARRFHTVAGWLMSDRRSFVPSSRRRCRVSQPKRVSMRRSALVTAASDVIVTVA